MPPLTETLRNAFSLLRISTPEPLVPPQPLSQNPVTSQALANLSDREDHLPTLSTGVYTITNVKNRNWAVLVNDNDRSDVISGTNADKDAGEKVTSANSYERQL